MYETRAMIVVHEVDLFINQTSAYIHISFT